MLESLYGDKDLIANKLKSQLKNICSRGKSDYDVVIDLVTDVNNIVFRLKAIGKEEVLHVDIHSSFSLQGPSLQLPIQLVGTGYKFVQK